MFSLRFDGPGAAGWILAVAALGPLSACNPGDDDDDDASPREPAVYGSYQVAGVLTYEFVPYSSTGVGLNYDATTSRPIRGVSVSLLDAATDEVIAETVSGEDGSYSFTYDGTNQVKLWIYAETVTPPITVEDNTSNDAVYVLESKEIDATQTSSLDAVAATGWGGSSYTNARAAAPFAVLDAAYSSAHKFLDNVTPEPDFPALHIHWSVNNRPASGDVSDGEITTSHWNGEELYILGQEDVDTDEFDTHVSVHEWGHYFESMIGRSDSIGGPHSDGDVLDPRVAFGEGWGNALSAIVLDPDTVYTDSYGSRQRQGFEFDLEENYVAADGHPGWYSEGSVQAILFDLYDADNETYDGAALGMQPIYEVMIGAQKDTEALTTIFSFIAGLKDAYPDIAADVDALVTYHTASSTYGIDEVEDAWAAGESHTGGTGTLPLYASKEIGDSFNVTLQGGEDFNKLAQNRFFKFSGDGSRVTVTSDCDFDVDLLVVQHGEEIAYVYTTSGNETVSFNTQSGATYILNVMGFAETAGSYVAGIEISH